MKLFRTKSGGHLVAATSQKQARSLLYECFGSLSGCLPLRELKPRSRVELSSDYGDSFYKILAKRCAEINGPGVVPEL